MVIAFFSRACKRPNASAAVAFEQLADPGDRLRRNQVSRKWKKCGQNGENRKKSTKMENNCVISGRGGADALWSFI
jgi:hypothetical protein